MVVLINADTATREYADGFVSQAELAITLANKLLFPYTVLNWEEHFLFYLGWGRNS